MTINDWIRYHTNSSSDDTVLIRELRMKLTDKQIEWVLECLSDVCTQCWDGSKRCYCCRDD